MPKNIPVVSLITAAALGAIAGILLLSGNADDGTAGARLVDAITTAVPVLLTAGAYAERNSKDIRNGTLTEKARLGTSKALTEHGVVTREGPIAEAVSAQTRALVALLETSQPRRDDLAPQLTQAADKLDAERAESSGPPDG